MDAVGTVSSDDSNDLHTKKHEGFIDIIIHNKPENIC